MARVRPFEVLLKGFASMITLRVFDEQGPYDMLQRLIRGFEDALRGLAAI